MLFINIAKSQPDVFLLAFSMITIYWISLKVPYFNEICLRNNRGRRLSSPCRWDLQKSFWKLDNCLLKLASDRRRWWIFVAAKLLVCSQCVGGLKSSNFCAALKFIKQRKVYRRMPEGCLNMPKKQIYFIMLGFGSKKNNP